MGGHTGYVTDANSDMNKTRLHDSDAGAVRPQILFQQGSDKGTLVFDNCGDSSGKFLAFGCAGEQSQSPPPPHPSFPVGQ